MIEDQQQFRDFAARLPERADLAVLVAGDRREGLRVFREHQLGSTPSFST